MQCVISNGYSNCLRTANGSSRGIEKKNNSTSLGYYVEALCGFDSCFEVSQLLSSTDGFSTCIPGYVFWKLHEAALLECAKRPNCADLQISSGITNNTNILPLQSITYNFNSTCPSGRVNLISTCPNWDQYGQIVITKWSFKQILSGQSRQVRWKSTCQKPEFTHHRQVLNIHCHFIYHTDFHFLGKKVYFSKEPCDPKVTLWSSESTCAIVRQIDSLIHVEYRPLCCEGHRSNLLLWTE